MWCTWLYYFLDGKLLCNMLLVIKWIFLYLFFIIFLENWLEVLEGIRMWATFFFVPFIYFKSPFHIPSSKGCVVWHWNHKFYERRYAFMLCEKITFTWVLDENNDDHELEAKPTPNNSTNPLHMRRVISWSFFSKLWCFLFAFKIVKNLVQGK